MIQKKKTVKNIIFFMKSVQRRHFQPVLNMGIFRSRLAKRSQNFLWVRLFILIILTLISPHSLNAQPIDNATDEEGVVENSHDSIRSGLFEMTDEIDAFFGDIRSLEQRQSDWFRARIAARTQSGSGSSLSQGFGASINLDAISKRLKFVIQGTGGDDPDLQQRSGLGSSTDLDDDFTSSTKDNSVSSGLRFDLFSDSDLLIRFNSGIKFRSGMNLYPFVSARASRWFDLGHFAVEPQLALIMEREDGFGQEVRLDFNKDVRNYLVRFRSQATHFEDRSAIEVFEELSFYRQLRTRSFMGAAISYLSPYENHPIRYRSSVRYRRQFWKPWLYAELEPGVDFPEDRDYDATPFIVLRFDIYFDRDPYRYNQ